MKTDNAFNSLLKAAKTSLAVAKKSKKDRQARAAHARRVEAVTLHPSDLRFKLAQRGVGLSREVPDASSPRAGTPTGDAKSKKRPTVIKLEGPPTPTTNGRPISIRRDQPVKAVYGGAAYKKRVIKPVSIAKAKETRRFKAVQKEREERKELAAALDDAQLKSRRCYFLRLLKLGIAPTERTLHPEFYKFREERERSQVAKRRAAKVTAACAVSASTLLSLEKGASSGGRAPASSLTRSVTLRTETRSEDTEEGEIVSRLFASESESEEGEIVPNPADEPGRGYWRAEASRWRSRHLEASNAYIEAVEASGDWRE